ncbi:MAG: entericidin A/B family lipoprotein [Solirubrobacterales bacterium]
MRAIRPKAIARSEGSSIPLLPLAFLVLVTALSMAGCNTVSGMGEDISAAGKGIDRTSERTQEKLSGESTAESPSSTRADRDYQSGRY